MDSPPQPGRTYDLPAQEAKACAVLGSKARLLEFMCFRFELASLNWDSQSLWDAGSVSIRPGHPRDRTKADAKGYRLREDDGARGLARVPDYFLVRAATRLHPSECCGCPLLISATI